MNESNPYHHLYFPRFTVRPSLSPDRPLLADKGMSDIYAELIDEHWRSRAAGEIVDVLTTQESGARDQAWDKIGSQLTRDLLAMGTYAGLSFDGQLGLDAELAWIPQFYADGLGVLDLRVTYNAHARLKWPVKNITWNSLQAISDDSWLYSLWANIKSGWFNQGADMLMSVYDTDVTTTVKWGESLTFAAFGRTLAQAVGWMIPMEENLGFIVGMPRESALYTNLFAERPSTSSMNQ